MKVLEMADQTAMPSPKISHFIDPARIVVNHKQPRPNPPSKKPQPSKKNNTTIAETHTPKPFFSKAASQSVQNSSQPSPKNSPTVQAVRQEVKFSPGDDDFMEQPYKYVSPCKNEEVQVRLPFFESEYDKYLFLLEHFSYENFTVPLKFRRFTNLLKKRYQNHPQVHKQHTDFVLYRKGTRSTFTRSMQKGQLEEYFSQPPEEPTRKGSLKAQTEVKEGYSPKVNLKMRPSSGIPLHKGSIYSVKKRKYSLAQASPMANSLESRHIQALTFSQRMKSLPIERPPIRYPQSYHTISLQLKPTSKPKSQSRSKGKSPRKRGGVNFLAPWESQMSRTNTLGELQINLRVGR